MTWENGGRIVRRSVAPAPVKCREMLQPDHRCHFNAVVDGYCRLHDPEAALQRAITGLRLAVQRYEAWRLS